MRSAVIRQLHGLSVGARLGTQSNLHECSCLSLHSKSLTLWPMLDLGGLFWDNVLLSGRLWAIIFCKYWSR